MAVASHSQSNHRDFRYWHLADIHSARIPLEPGFADHESLL
jgi:hypothetical protein